MAPKRPISTILGTGRIQSTRRLIRRMEAAAERDPKLPATISKQLGCPDSWGDRFVACLGLDPDRFARISAQVDASLRWMDKDLEAAMEAHATSLEGAA